MVLAIVLARSFGVEGYGLYVFSIGTAVLAGMAASFGWPHVINREMPRLIREESWGLVRGLNRAAEASTAIVALVLGAGMFWASFGFPPYAHGLRMAALLTGPLALLLMRQQQLFAVDRPTLALTLDQGMTASMVLLIFFLHPMSTDATLGVYGVVAVVLLLLGTIVFRARLPLETFSAKPVYVLKDWYGSAAAMFASRVPRLFVTRLDVLLVAPLAGFAEAGLFGSAFRLSVLMTFPQFILQSLVTPRFSRAFAAGNLLQVRRLFLLSLAFALLTSVPILLPILLAPELVMATVFGPDFEVGGRAMLWLAIGQFVAALGIPLSTMIAMGGNHHAMGRQGLAIAAATFIAGLLIIPNWGAAGGGMVLAGSNALWIAGMAWLARPILLESDGAKN